MKRNILTLTLALLLLAALLVGCAKPAPAAPTGEQPASTGETAGTDTAAPADTQAPEDPVDIEALYEAGMAKIKGEQGDELVLLPETDPEFVESLFPGLTSIDMAQYKLALSPVTNGPVEVVLSR